MDVHGCEGKVGWWAVTRHLIVDAPHTHLELWAGHAVLSIP